MDVCWCVTLSMMIRMIWWSDVIHFSRPIPYIEHELEIEVLERFIWKRMIDDDSWLGRAGQGRARAAVKCSIKEWAYCSQAINMEQQVAHKSWNGYVDKSSRVTRDCCSLHWLLLPIKCKAQRHIRRRVILYSVWDAGIMRDNQAKGKW